MSRPVRNSLTLAAIVLSCGAFAAGLLWLAHQAMGGLG